MKPLMMTYDLSREYEKANTNLNSIGAHLSQPEFRKNASIINSNEHSEYSPIGLNYFFQYFFRMK